MGTRRCFLNQAKRKRGAVDNHSSTSSSSSSTRSSSSSISSKGLSRRKSCNVRRGILRRLSPLVAYLRNNIAKTKEAKEKRKKILFVPFEVSNAQARDMKLLKELILKLRRTSGARAPSAGWMVSSRLIATCLMACVGWTLNLTRKIGFAPSRIPWTTAFTKQALRKTCKPCVLHKLESTH